MFCARWPVQSGLDKTLVPSSTSNRLVELASAGIRWGRDTISRRIGRNTYYMLEGLALHTGFGSRTPRHNLPLANGRLGSLYSLAEDSTLDWAERRGPESSVS
jgi:hypothetical protein